MTTPVTGRMKEAGLSLVEVLVAAALIGVALVPLMQLYPDILATDLESEISMRLGTVAVRTMEGIIAQLRNNIASVVSGAQVCPDLPGCRVERTIATEASSAVAGVGSLVTVAVVACVDKDADSACDAAETQVRYDAKVTSRP